MTLASFPHAGPHGALGEEDPQQFEKVGDRLEKFMDSALKPPKKRVMGMGIVGRLLNRYSFFSLKGQRLVLELLLSH